MLKTHILDLPSLAVIIDQWHVFWKKIDGQFVRNLGSDFLPNRIINFVETTPAISTMVLSSYLCAQELDSDTVWYQNRKQLFEHDSRYDPMIQQEHNDNLYMEQKTHPVLLNYVNDRVFQVAMRQQWELETYLAQNTSIKNIYVCGSDWNICVKGQVLGWSNLYKHIGKQFDVNILTHLDTVSVDNPNGKYPETPTLDQDWKPITEKIYQYCPD